MVVQSLFYELLTVTAAQADADAVDADAVDADAVDADAYILWHRTVYSQRARDNMLRCIIKHAF